MRIEPYLNYWIIVRGRDRNESCFCLYVDDDRASWTRKKTWECCRFPTRQEAEDAIAKLRQRAAMQRSRRKQRKIIRP